MFKNYKLFVFNCYLCRVIAEGFLISNCNTKSGKLTSDSTIDKSILL